MTNELPSNTSSSWPPTRLTYTSGRPTSRARARAIVLALALLVDLVGRGIDDDEQLARRRARASCAASGSQMSSQTSMPDPEAADSRRRSAARPAGNSASRRTPCSWAARPCGGWRATSPPRDQRRGVVDAARGCTRGSRACTATSRTSRAHARQARLDLAAEAAVEQQVLGRIAREGQLRETAPGRRRARSRACRAVVDDARGIALHVADQQVELRQGDLQ